MAEGKPLWLEKKTIEFEKIHQIKKLLRSLNLHTVCESARCPNINECFEKPTATFMILGNVCTRNCTFCNIFKGKPATVDYEEPKRILEAVKRLKLNHAVITSVTRDDLKDGGASLFAEVIYEIRSNLPEVSVEVLTPDFLGAETSVQKVIESQPHIVSHNLETVPRLYSRIRPLANHKRSLEVLNLVKKLAHNIVVKSGLMVGLGETQEEVVSVMEDLRNTGCDILTIGQYFQPSKKHFPVKEFIDLSTFGYYREVGYNLGFKVVAANPFVRSSYNAEQMLANI